MESLKFRPLTIAELQSDIEILSQNGLGSTHKGPAQKKWLNKQSSVKRNSQFVPRIQYTNESPSDKNITKQFRVLTLAELQADIDVLSGRENLGSAKKSINPRSHPTAFSAKYDKSESKSKFYTKRVYSTSIPKLIRRSIGKSGVASKRNGTDHSKIKKTLTFGTEITKISQIRNDKSSSSSIVSIKSTQVRDSNSMSSNQMTNHKLRKSQSEKLYSPSATTSRLNIKSLARTLSASSRISGVNFCAQTPVTSNSQLRVTNNENSRIMNESKAVQSANVDLSRISESPTSLQLSKANTTSNSDESFLAREKEICCDTNQEIDKDNKDKDFTPEKDNLDKLLGMSTDGDDTLCFENSVIFQPDTNIVSKELQVEHGINVLCDKLTIASKKVTATAYKQYECILQFKNKLEMDRQILLRQNKHLQKLLNSNKEMLDAINNILTLEVEDETTILNKAAESPNLKEDTEYNAISNVSTPPSSKSKSSRCENSPVFLIPKKSCLRKKVLNKSFGAESQMTLIDGQVDDKPHAMYMKMKENWNFLQTPNKSNFNTNTESLTQSSPLISFSLQRQLDKLYGKDTSQI